MEKIDSFKVDHTKLMRGIYVSRRDNVNDSVITTFDIRMKLPNREPAIGLGALHTIEHLGATFLRNNYVWGNRVIYWGPMGCCTGFYLILSGSFESKSIVNLIRELFQWISCYEGDIPGANAHDCGNYLENNLTMAKYEAREYLKTLVRITKENLIYPAG